MNKNTVRITCRDPIVSRDGRPFGPEQGNRMRAVEWPLPSVVAGSLRTTVGKAAGKEFSDTTASELLHVSVSSVFPEHEGVLYLPAPDDCVYHPDKGPLRARPDGDEDACDLPAEGLKPVMLSADDAPDEFKPEAAPAWWPVDRYAAWLTGRPIGFDTTFLNRPEVEERTHVSILPETGAAEEGRLFTTAALPLTRLPRFGAKPASSVAERYAEISLLTRVEATGWTGDAIRQLDVLHPLGGERRLAHWRTVEGADPWGIPTVVAEALGKARRVRMTLATPAIFSRGWRPDWLNEQLIGKIGRAHV
jgi:CRISPR-associated protein Cmr3